MASQRHYVQCGGGGGGGLTVRLRRQEDGSAGVVGEITPAFSCCTLGIGDGVVVSDDGSAEKYARHPFWTYGVLISHSSPSDERDRERESVCVCVSSK